jgi:hypothetical protein
MSFLLLFGHSTPTPPPEIFSGGNARIGFAQQLDALERVGSSRLVLKPVELGNPLDDSARIGDASANIKTGRIGNVMFTAKKGRIGS